MKRSERQLRRRTGLWEPLRIGKKRNHHAQQYLEGLQTQTLRVQHPATKQNKTLCQNWCLSNENYGKTSGMTVQLVFDA